MTRDDKVCAGVYRRVTVCVGLGTWRFAIIIMDLGGTSGAKANCKTRVPDYLDDIIGREQRYIDFFRLACPRHHDERTSKKQYFRTQWPTRAGLLVLVTTRQMIQRAPVIRSPASRKHGSKGDRRSS